MDSSRGVRRPPALCPSRLTVVAAGLLGTALSAVPVQAQPSPGLLAWLRQKLEAVAPPVLAAGPGTPDQPAIPPGSVVGEVRVVAKDIFDAASPGEGNRLFRIANRLHRTTRPGVIQSQLLFRPGDVFSPELVQASARLLRTNDYL